MSVRRSLLVMMLVFLLLPAVVFYSRANQGEVQTPAAQLQQYVVTRGDVQVNVTAIGRIEADQVARLSFTGAGQVSELAFEAGDYVLAGEVLAQQENTVQQNAVQQAQLALQMAELQKQKLLTGPDEGQIRIAEANLQAAQSAAAGIASAVSPEEILALELAYQQAQGVLDAATQARATAPGDQPEQAYALLDARVGQASFNLEIARLQLEAARTGSPAASGAAYARVTQAERELERLQSGPTQAEIDRADATIEQRRLELEAAERALERTVLTSPFEGYVSTVSTEIGAVTLPGVAALELTDTNPLRLTVQVDEIDIREIREGMPAMVRLDALSGVELDATLERIDLVATNNAGIVSYDVLVRLDETEPRVRVGMTAEAAVVVESRSDVLVVPNQYIRLDRGRNRAYVNLLNADGTLEEIEVTLGLQGQDSSEIVSGLREGDVVAVDLGGDALGLFGG
jgi:HlyD family secretion protein